MPRVARESNNTTYFHVLVQGINKSYIFEERMDILYYIKQMYEIKEEVGVNIVAYCIIENFLEEWQIRQEDLKHDKQKLKELIIMIRQEENVSIRWIGNKLGIHREIIRNLLK